MAQNTTFSAPCTETFPRIREFRREDRTESFTNAIRHRPATPRADWANVVLYSMTHSQGHSWYSLFLLQVGGPRRSKRALPLPPSIGINIMVDVSKAQTLNAAAAIAVQQPRRSSKLRDMAFTNRCTRSESILVPKGKRPKSVASGYGKPTDGLACILRIRPRIASQL